MHWKESVLVVHKFLRLFLNTLTVDEKHYLLKRDNLAQAIKIQLSQKQKNFSEFFFAFLKSILNFKYLSKKVSQLADVFPDIPPPKYMVRQMSKKPCFREILEKQHGKWCETFFQSEWQHFYNIY